MQKLAPMEQRIAALEQERGKIANEREEAETASRVGLYGLKAQEEAICVRTDRIKR